MTSPLLTLEVRIETDVIVARQRARQIAYLIGLPSLDQTRVATAVSEIARDTIEHAGGGRVEFSLENRHPLVLWIRVEERLSGVKNLQAIADGTATVPSSLTAGIISAKRLMDQFKIDAGPKGNAILTMSKTVTRRAGPLPPNELQRIASELVRNAPKGLIDELQIQNQELLRTLQELKERQAEVAQMHRKELEETNRGVVALYTELDDDLKSWRRMSDLKTRFLSNMSHEFRSPLNTILNLTAFLLDHSDGELNSEQEKQVGFIRRAAEGLVSLVNDLLDIAKVDAGKATLRIEAFKVEALFEQLQDSIRPLIDNGGVQLVFEESADLPTLHQDEGKIAQVLRNFLSNAVKYTERGEIRVSAIPGANDTMIFSVSDTGIGIAPEDQDQIFEEFVQIEGPRQGKIKGTGLGLPLCRKLAEFLGGAVHVKSQLGIGATFFLVIPRIHPEHEQEYDDSEPVPYATLDPSVAPVLVVEDDPIELLLYRKHLEGSGFGVVPARTLVEARRLVKQIRPVAVLLDIVLEVEDGWTFLAELKNDPETADIPIVVLTVIDGQERAMEMGAFDFCMKPIEREWLLDRLSRLKAAGPVETILIIDDEKEDRIRLREILNQLGRFDIVETASGADGLLRVRDRKFNVIFLDLVLPDTTGFEVLNRLRSEEATRDVPVIITTSSPIEETDLGLLKQTTAIVSRSVRERDEVLAKVREAMIKAGLCTVGAVRES